ncbi:DSBA-like thioredoxin domain-containing protein [Diplogelasinospora grovesii]|uniref:DSBA-like thioredoxin domain-containing protein n=1 Tax=Diplogelasinospora grovesii TaxID=303347 RepID=A0AAN6N9E9_9PEZI|nr:DSBA-like thioredoxin domain-containing protein [Diplogelasinospora grovesii]
MKFTIEIFADTVCPWCYLGKRKLDAAINTHRERYPGDEFDLVWRPFILFPEAKVSSYDKQEVLNLIYRENTPTVLRKLERAGEDHGIRFRWDGRTGNAADSHKIILLAALQDSSFSSQCQSPPFSSSSVTPFPPTTPTSSSSSTFPLPISSLLSTPTPEPQARGHQKGGKKQDKVIEVLCSGALQNGEDLSDRNFLIRVALECGLAADEKGVKDWLDSEEAARLLADARHHGTPTTITTATAGQQQQEQKPTEDNGGRKLQITAVPSYLVQGRFYVGGMQESDVFVRLFERICGLQQSQSPPYPN